MHNRFVPSETALVLGGGGAKGAYEIGVIDALEELGICASSAYGTSIGALNAAMYAQDRMDEARALWDSLRLSDVVTPQSMELAEEAEAIFSRPDKLLDFLSRNAQHRGIDTAPMMDVIRAHIDEDRLRRSTTRFGLVVTRFPSLSMLEKRLEDMAPGSVCDFLLASCSCFPAMPMKQIGGERYLDGGFCDNVPVETAIRAGAKRIIAVDIGRSRAHTRYDRRPNITYIRTSWPLGGLLAFDPERSRRNRAIGRLDALRAFGQLRGTCYAFDPIDAQTLRSRAQDFVVMLTRFEADIKKDTPLFAPLEEELRPGADDTDYFLRALELCARILDIDPTKIYTFSSMCGAIRESLPLEQAEAMLGSLLGGRIGVLFAPPQPDRKIVLACLYHLLRREGSFSSLALHTLSAFPRELVCALTLREIL